MSWYESDNYLSTIHNKQTKIHDPVRVAGFDLDDTLIRRPTRRGPDVQWELLDTSLPGKIAETGRDGYIIVIFSNQGGMSINRNFDKMNWRRQMEAIIKLLFAGVKHYYCAVYVSKKYDLYRKPNLGLWYAMKKDLRDEFPRVKIRISKLSFYCGDAAGRIGKSALTGQKKGDHSDTDRKLAINIGIPFMTPEDYILDTVDDMPFQLSGLDPREYLTGMSSSTYNFRPRKKEIIILNQIMN